MPRTNDPLGILTGGGLASPGSVSPSSLTPGEVGGASSSLAAHVEDPSGAHPATAISTVDLYDRYTGMNVQVSLDDLAALIPPSMGGVGSSGVVWLGSTNSGVPDWGVLKLWDGVLPFTGSVSADARAVYPYYYRAPVTSTGAGLTGTGVDAPTDPTFNVYDGGFPAYTGGGVGKAHAGFGTFLNGGTVAFPSWRILSAVANPAAVVSGIVSPADRGVLALVKWPSGANPKPPVAASVADVQNVVVAALLLGKGVLDNGCDGEPGGIFTEASGGTRALAYLTFNVNPPAPYTITIDLSALPGGPPAPVTFTATAVAPTNEYEFHVGATAADTANNLALVLNVLYFPGVVLAASFLGNMTFIPNAVGTVGNSISFTDTAPFGALTATSGAGGTDAPASPYNFPGRAAGQYNLDEIHSGIPATAGPGPFPNPAAGQVRLLTDPAAVPFSPGTVPGGLPIFGATTYAIGTTPVVPFLPYGLGGGTDGNFFAYRLPYLKDYDPTTGIHYTPAIEKPRYTSALLPASVGTLSRAGDYDNFGADFWGFQLARYRHRFALATGAAATRLDGSYALVHFKKEAYFEDFAVHGVVPTNDRVYSVNLVSWTGVTPNYDVVKNLVEINTLPTASAASPMNRTEVLEDTDGSTPVTSGGTLDFGLDTASAQTTYYSGVKYYVPLDRTAFNTPCLSINFLDVDLVGAFDNTYRTHDTLPSGGGLAPPDERAYALNQNLAFLSLSSFSYEGDEALGITGITSGSPYATVFHGQLGQFRRQRIEYGYADVADSSLDPYAPQAPDHLRYTFNTIAGAVADGIHFTGDLLKPAFTSDAQVRMFVRKPLNVDGTTGYPSPYSGGTGAVARGFTLTNTAGPGTKVLFHSMREDNTVNPVYYGNPFTLTRANLDKFKDVSERFLDEVYRYPENWAPLLSPDSNQLQGPGLPFGPAPIAVPVRPVNGDPNYPGWFFQNYHTGQLANADPNPNYNNALQVTGLPPRNPDYTEGLTAPFPSRGLLVYPQTNFSAGYVPPGNPDYSTLTGNRCYVRAFDAGAGNTGASEVSFRLWGVDLSDFKYTPPTAPGATGMAVMVKCPGLTTWMDAGRLDGSGPSKQDIALDGAGCLVSASSGTDTTTQLHYTDVKVNLSPAALFSNGLGMCPVLVKVVIKDNPTGKALNFANTANPETDPTSGLRGLVGIDIISP